MLDQHVLEPNPRIPLRIVNLSAAKDPRLQLQSQSTDALLRGTKQMSNPFHIVVCAGIVPDPLQTLEPVTYTQRSRPQE